MSRGEERELGRLLREAVRLIESANLQEANETLKRASAAAAVPYQVVRTPAHNPKSAPEHQRTRVGGSDHAG